MPVSGSMRLACEPLQHLAEENYSAVATASLAGCIWYDIIAQLGTKQACTSMRTLFSSPLKSSARTAAMMQRACGSEHDTGTPEPIQKLQGPAISGRMKVHMQSEMVLELSSRNDTAESRTDTAESQS